MGAVNTSYTFSATDTITSTKMNDIIDQTVMTSESISGTTLQVTPSGKLAISSQGITSNELASDSVTGIKILNNAVTPSKLSAGAPTWTGSGAFLGSVYVQGKEFIIGNGSYDNITSYIGANRVGSGYSALAFSSGVGTENNGKTSFTRYATDQFTISHSGYDNLVFENATTGYIFRNKGINTLVMYSDNNSRFNGTLFSDTNAAITKVYVGNFGTNSTGIKFTPFSAGASPNEARACMFYAPDDTTERGSIKISNTGTSFNTASDYRLKTVIGKIDNCLEMVKSLKPWVYQWNECQSKSMGFLAHELQEVVPDAVSGIKDAVDENGNMKIQSVDLSKVVPLLTAAIQEQQKQINELRSLVVTG